MTKLDESFANSLVEGLGEDWSLVLDTEGRSGTEFRHSCGAALSIEKEANMGKADYLVVWTTWRIEADGGMIDLLNYVAQPPKTQFQITKGIDDPQKVTALLQSKVVQKYVPMYQAALAEFRHMQTNRKAVTEACQSVINQYPDSPGQVTGRYEEKFEFYREGGDIRASGSFLQSPSRLVGYLQLNEISMAEVRQILEVILPQSKDWGDAKMVSVPEVHTGTYAIDGELTDEEAIEMVRQRSGGAHYLGSEYSRDEDSSMWSVEPGEGKDSE